LPHFNLWFPVAGFVVGVLVGLTGVGGGALMTPLLLLGFGLPPSLAVGTDLVYATCTKLIGTWQHWRQGTVNIALVRDLALGSIPASLVAVRSLAWLRGTYVELAELWLGRMIGAALLLVALLMLQRLFQQRVASWPLVQEAAGHPRAGVIAVGALGGFLVGLTSVGSGSVIMALLILIVSLSTPELVGSNIAHATLLVGIAAVGHFFLGEVDLMVVALLLVGSVPGVLLGSRLVLKVPQRALQLILAGLLMASSVPLLR